MAIDIEEPTDDYDAFWKEALDHFLPDFLRLTARKLHDAVDWTQPFEPQNTEFQAIFPTTDRTGRRFVDRIYRVTLLDGTQARILLHIEVQVGRDKNIARRILIYRIHIEMKLEGPVYNLLVLADDDPEYRPDLYEETVLDQTHRLTIPIVKLHDFRHRIDELARDDNPFALLLIAWFRTRETAPDRKRLAYKIGLLQLLRAKRYSRDRINQVLSMIDWLVRLPRPLLLDFKREAERLDGESDMPIVPPLGELYKEEGIKEGIEKGIEKGTKDGDLRARRESVMCVVETRFGPVPPTLPRILGRIEDPDTLVEMLTNAVTAKTVYEFIDTFPPH